MSHRERVKDYREALRKQHAEIETGGRTKFWKPKKLSGKNDPSEGNRIRLIVPPYMTPDPEYGVVISPWVKYRQYRIPGVNGKTKMVVVPSDYGQPDPVEDWVMDLEEGNSRDREKAKALSKRQRFIALIVDMDEAPDAVIPWEFGPQVAEQIMKYALHRSYNLPWDTDEGHDLWVRLWGEGLDTEYEVIPEPRPSALEGADKLLKLAGKIDLAKFVIVETPETIEDILDGHYDKDLAKERREKRDKLRGRPLPLFTGGGDDHEDDEVPATSRRSSRRSDPEPEEAPPPARSRRRRGETKETAEPELSLGVQVRFIGDGGEELTGEVTELHLDDNDPYVTVDTGDGEPWDVNKDEVVIVPAEPAPVEEEKPAKRRRSRSSAPEKEDKPDPPVRLSRGKKANDEADADGAPSVNKSSIVDRVNQLQQNARGGK